MRPSRETLTLVLLACVLGITIPIGAANLAFSTIDAPGATATWANGINDAGQIVGNFQSADGKIHGYLRSSEGAFTTMDVPGATATDAFGINNAGQIAGSFWDAGGKIHGYVATPTQ